MEISESLPKYISYINERGQVVDQLIDYEWLPTKCSQCKKLGHTTSSCKFVDGVVWRKKEAVTAPVAECSKHKKTASLSKPVQTPSAQTQSKEEDESQPEKLPKDQGFNIMSWNVRGLNKRNKQLSIVDICKLNKICIGALLETKIKGERIKEVMSSSFMGWDFYSILSLEGRILLIWKASYVKIEVIKDHVQFLHCQIWIWATGQSFCLTVVYGSNQLEARRVLWFELSALTFPVKPWLIVGDFNAVFDSADRIGGKVISIKEHQDGNKHIFSKLDRVFFNEDWLDSFPNVSAIANWEVVSDHCAIVLKHIPVQKEGLRPF
ncbi:uncharacterized protein LOC133785658 [Humulus lupulus]|uniref:uncharacterized protein LOC133785658 n=1 Tax=Humulus lupulus TaxID=3486 RepID=UPI002B407764|nr:uncharacterized protein LOC133785658 [Humulus lupulus]